MPWRCPACGTNVQHSTELPRANCVYRCPVCRLQMVFDPLREKMQPLPPGGDTGENAQSVA
jgi:DNA-directed RNA polymerase subunit RPC12/RpoP